ncbi:MAG: RIP metalloprotease RseP [Myxococcota bacterium]
MGALQNIIFFAIFIGVLVTVHELGHFLAAKWANVKVLKFSVGFGPKLFGFRRGETEYQIAAIPLGGFVRMAGEIPGDDVPEEDVKRSFLSAPWWKRAIIVVAGPAFNLIFPIIAYFFVFVGDHQVLSPRVGWVEPDYPAARAGIQPGDVIVKVDGARIRAFEEIRSALDGVWEREVAVTVKRGEQELVLRITPMKHEESTPLEKVKRGLLGVSPIARPAIIGVPKGSVAETAGLETFDRVLSINGEIVRDEVQLSKVLAGKEGTLSVVVIRSELVDVGGAQVVAPELVTLSVPRQPGEGFAALGGAESADTYVWTVFPGSPAAKAGLKRGDKLVSIDGAPLSSWFTVRTRLKAAERGEFTLAWLSDGVEKSQKLSQVSEDEYDELNNKSEVLELGVRPRAAFLGEEVLAGGPEAEKVTVHMGPVDAAVASVRAVPEGIRAIALIMGKLVTRDIPLESVGGPIMLFQVAAKSAEAGWEVFLKNMALVSVNLGLVNLLPIPILDGFGLLAALWEGIRRRPIPLRAREIANIVGLVVLAMLVVLVFKNDITKLLR